MLGGQTALCKRRSGFKLGKSRKFSPQFLQSRGFDVLAHLLLKISDLQIIPQFYCPLQRRDQSQDTFQKCGLSDTVGSGEHDSLSPLHLKIQRAGQGLFIADDQIMSFHQIASRCPGLFKMEFRFRLLRRQFDHVHLVQFLLSGHGHVPRRHTRLVSRHKILQFRDFLLLTIICRFQLRLFHRVNLLEFVIIAHIAVQLLIIHMVNQVDNAVEKRDVMRYEDKRVFIIIQIPFQPLNMNCIQIIGRLVQKQDVRLFQEKLSQQHLGTLSAGQLCHIPVQSDIRKPQGAPDLFHFRIDHIKIMGGQKLLDHAGLFHIVFHLFFRSICHLFIHLVHLCFQIKQEAESRSQYVPDGHTFFQYRVLIQIPHPDIFCPFNLTFIRL